MSTQLMDLERIHASPDTSRVALASERPLERRGERPRSANGGRADLLADFAPVGLGEMQAAALQDRVEVKYVMESATLMQNLPKLRASYYVLEVEGERLNRYRTLYFDTEGLTLYHRHHMGARNRYKVRAREYVESHLAFFEVKHKTNKGRTVKYRIATPELVTGPEELSDQLLRQICPYCAEELTPCLWNHYKRVTLVSKDMDERVTLDIGLHFAWGERQAMLPGIVIAEVKQSRHASRSPFVQLMHELHMNTGGFSKYCVGLSYLYPESKQNNFKPIQRRVARLMQGASYVAH